MKTLSRPMFKMGGPIKEGVMHGIREPHFRGKIVGSAMPHIQRAWRGFQGLFGSRAPKQVEIGSQIKWRPPVTGHQRGYTGVAKPGGWERGAPITETQNIFTPKPWAAATGKYLASSPEGRAVKWIWDGKGWVAQTAKGIAKSPTAAIGLTYAGGRWLWPDGTEATDAEAKNMNVPLNPNLQAIQEKNKTTTTENAAAFAKSQREERLNRYLKLMGYDQSKKTAIADALIDASKIVSDRGTLDKKNITAELINPIIQATSKRLDKPDQIREAVGLMMTKGEIEKDLEDPQVKKLRALQIEKGEKELTPGVGPSIMAYMAAKKGKVKGDELKDLVRLAANQEGTPFTYMSEEDIAKFPQLEGKTALEIVSSTAEKDGVYMVGDAVIEIKGGIPKQIK